MLEKASRRTGNPVDSSIIPTAFTRYVLHAVHLGRTLVCACTQSFAS
jgi:hypothetical protein